MIALVLAQIRARWGQAVTLLVLSAAVTGAAVSASVYASAVDVSATTGARQVDSRRLLVSLPPARQSQDRAAPMEDYGNLLAELPSFQPVLTTQIEVHGLFPDAPDSVLHRLVARDGFCHQVVFTAGRCPVGTREVALPAGLAEEADLRPGDRVVLTPMFRTDRVIYQDGAPTAVTVSGTVEPRDPTDPYWDAGLDPLGRRTGAGAIITHRGVLATWEHGQELVYADGVLPRAALELEAVPRIRAELARAEEMARRSGATAQGLATALPSVLDRITEHGADARALLPITAAPLVALCWMVVYLAVSHGVSQRRQEVGLVALRGVRPRTRAVAVALESLAPVLVGAPLGIAGAHLLVWLAGPADPPLVLDGGQLSAAGFALAGAVVAVLVALRGALILPVAQLLRRVPPRRRAAVAAVELLAVAFAVVIVADLRVFDRELAGLSVAAPAVVMLAVAVLAARLVRPFIDLAGRWSLRRGRLGPAMAALYLARQPGAARLVVVLAMVLGMSGFALVSTDVAAQGRGAAVERELGAHRVLTVEGVDPGTLLAAVRAVDPAGEYAMAAAGSIGGGDITPRLAVDSTRLAQVAAWSGRHGDLGPAEVAALLRPHEPELVAISDGELEVELEPAGPTTDGTVTVSVLLAPLAGGNGGAVELGPVTGDQRAYRAEVTGCPDGCRLAGLAATVVAGESQYGVGERFAIVVGGLSQDGQEVAAGWFDDATRWHSPYDGGFESVLRAREVAGGLELVHMEPTMNEPYPVLAADTPQPLPVITAGDAMPGVLVRNLDGEQMEARRMAELDGLPGLGGLGVLMDLEYAERNLLEHTSAQRAEVWLSQAAPADVVDRLTAHGLVVSGDRRVTDLRTELDGGGAAQALRFFRIAAVGAAAVGLLALALVVAIDRGGWRQSMRQLRAQGLGRRAASRAGRWSYSGIVLAATLAGAVAAGAAWLAAGDRLPLGVEPALRPPWPAWSPVLVPWAVVVAALLLAGVAAGWLGRRERRI